MKIGIIIHSHTGNTLSVGEKLREVWGNEGHEVTLERVRAENEEPSEALKTGLAEAPEISPYDVVVFGAPVRGFSLSPVMKKYLQQIESLKGKEVFCFVTQELKSPIFGGNHSLGQMKQLCLSKGERVSKSGIVNWSNKKREEMIDKIIGDFTRQV
jgi:flavodoxin